MTGPTLNAQHARALTFLALDIRAATIGAGPWDEQGTFVNIMKREGQNLALVAQDVIRHAARTDARSPGVIASSFSPPEIVPVTTKRGNPHRHEECRQHPGQWPDNCAGCKTEAYDQPDETPPHQRNPGLDARLAKIVGGAS